MTAKLVAPKTCRRCKGTGDYHYASGSIGTCATCLGDGVIEGDKATLAARKAVQAEHDRIYGALRDLAHADRSTAWMLSNASDGLWLLQAAEPERAAKAIASIERRHPAVVEALAEYACAAKGTTLRPTRTTK